MHILDSTSWRYYIIALILAMAYGAALAHSLHYQPKSYEFYRAGHIIQVQLDSGNELHVMLDGIVVGSRTNFCTPEQQ